MDPIDGNALAGPLVNLFTPDLTSARGICAGCGQPSLLAETRVYDQAPGLVVRCAGCGEGACHRRRAAGQRPAQLRRVPLPRDSLDADVIARAWGRTLSPIFFAALSVHGACAQLQALRALSGDSKGKAHVGRGAALPNPRPERHAVRAALGLAGGLSDTAQSD